MESTASASVDQAATPLRVGHAREARRQAPRRNPQRDRRLIHARRCCRLHGTLLVR